jgi:hypothetical protein
VLPFRVEPNLFFKKRNFYLYFLFAEFKKVLDLKEWSRSPFIRYFVVWGLFDDDDGLKFEWL